MNRRALVAYALAVVALLTGLLATTSAAAQAISFAELSPERDHQNKPEILEQNVNRADCENDDFFRFIVLGTGLAGAAYQLQVWASVGSADCTMSDMQSGTSNSCKQVAAEVRAQDTMTVDVRVQDIVSRTFGPWSGPATNEGCDGSNDPDSRTLQFFLVSGSALVGAKIEYDVTFDLLGPGPPRSVKAGVGERVLVVSWREPTDATGIAEYRAYATPVNMGTTDGGTTDGGATDGGTTDAGEGGASSDAGVSDAGVPTGCVSNVLVPGEPPPAGISPRGETNSSTTQVEAGGLTNGVQYAVAVASVDEFGNSGNLSALACATPEPVTGFFEAYRAAGGGAGGGYCAIGAAPSRAAAGGIVFAALGLFLRRRRRAARANVRGAA
jgi:hypothetical protein